MTAFPYRPVPRGIGRSREASHPSLFGEARPEAAVLPPAQPGKRMISPGNSRSIRARSAS